MLLAHPVSSAVPVLAVEPLPDGTTCLVVTCADFDAFKALPRAVSFDGRVFARTAWNSDRGVACYRDDALVAMGV